ncbi:MAG TPA: cation:proton antiporter [Candidatus Saccharimonadales bacterium]|nr:cation:proton antiporter [Candidatus Saccharimonadales bacterium]
MTPRILPSAKWLRPFLLAALLLMAIYPAQALLQEPPDANAPQKAAAAAEPGDAGHDAAANEAGEESSGHAEPVMPILVALIVVLLGAKIGGELFELIHQPAVLGELIAGVAIGNADALLGTNIFAIMRSGPVHELLPIFAGLGVIILLFEVGLETSIEQMMGVGVSATLVAFAGVVAPWILGFGLHRLLNPTADFGAHLFVGAILTATSVGITARVFKDMGRLETSEARVILGAAVIDDVLGLVILSIVSGLVASGTIGFTSVLRIVVVATLFLMSAVFLGGKLAGVLTSYFGLFRVRGMKMITALLICFAMSWLAGMIGLATIVGAFAAGLILEEAKFQRFSRERPLHELLEPFSSFFVPIFFVLMGIDVNLEAFTHPMALYLAAGITAAAIIGKQVCGLVVTQKGLDRVSIGIGMIPRGEVGLIFASIGRALKVVDDELYAACVIMVIVTTFIAPIALQWRLRPSREKTS